MARSCNTLDADGIRAKPGPISAATRMARDEMQNINDRAQSAALYLVLALPNEHTMYACNPRTNTGTEFE